MLSASDSQASKEDAMAGMRRKPRLMRRRSVLALIAAGAVACGAVFGIQLASAGSTQTGPSAPGSGPEQGVQAANVISGVEKLKSTVMSNGYSGTSAPAFQYTPVDSAFTLKCPGTTTCTFTDDGTVQAGDTGSVYAICFKVDGTIVICPNQDLNGNYYTNGSISSTLSGITPGSHTVQTLVYPAVATTLYVYDLKYGVYTP